MTSCSLLGPIDGCVQLCNEQDALIMVTKTGESKDSILLADRGNGSTYLTGRDCVYNASHGGISQHLLSLSRAPSCKR